jgi:PAS domain S-box-containing protein
VLRRLLLYLVVLAIVVIPVSMTCWKIVQYSRVSKNQTFQLHHHIARTLALTITNYFQQLNGRLAFAPMLVRSANWSEQMAVLDSALMANRDFACVALLDGAGKERAKAYDASLAFFNKPLDYSHNAFFQKTRAHHNADTGSVYRRGDQSFFDILYPLENERWLLVSVRWESLKHLVFEQKVGQKGFIWLLDETGRIVGDSRQEHEGQVTMPGWSFFQERLADRDDNTLEWEGELTDPAKVPTVGAGSWVEGAGWFILSAQPQAEAYAEARQLRRSAFFWMFFSFAGMGFFAYFWVTYISLPITKLAIGVNNVAQRRFEAKVPEDFGLEEFRALGKAFNRMTKELQAYEALQVEKIIEEKTTVQSLLFSIMDGIIMIGEKGNLIFTNEPARRWVMDVAGRGKNFEFAWQSLQEYPPWTDVLQPMIDDEKPSASEEFEFPVQGRPRWAQVLAQQVLTEKGRRLGVMVVIRDVTQNKELDKMKEDFFNGITHDLRTPLAATIGYLGLTEMQMPETDPELGKLVTSARQSAKRALGLVETILSLARLQAGKLQINRVPIQAQALVSKIANEMSFHAQAKQIAISYECADPDLWVYADSALIERVVENLAGNAIKYTMENGWVMLRAQAVDEGVEFSVEDNGRGIPPEAMKKLFGKFQQVKAEDRAAGFGIGLSFSKGIVEAHGSSIQVESEVDKGSRFSFVLERIASPSQTAAAA